MHRGPTKTTADLQDALCATILVSALVYVSNMKIQEHLCSANRLLELWGRGVNQAEVKSVATTTSICFYHLYL